jgi:formylglycine-generating enzyme required for sulfatase activity/tRNA A-37 threonylcarbamoyl transferase component Bud32
MTRPDTSHPDPEQVRQFGLGQLPDDQARLIENHVTRCARCTRALQRLRDDTLLGLPRRADTSAECPEAPAAGAPLPETLAPSGDSSTLDDPATAAHPLHDHPRYRVLRRLGRGGMGEVYLAEHRHMGRLVALKVIRPSLLDNAAAVQRFRQEVRAVGRLAHPNIVHAHDAEEAAGRTFLVMEYVEGTSLAEWLAPRGSLPVAEACAYARQAALGLQCAHEQGLVHRDIKPHNLMRTPDGAVKILDFGLARVLREQAAQQHGQLTGEGAVVGTADYIAPEQARDSRQADIRADIYSLGCTLYHLLSGRVPFPQGTAIDKIVQHSIDDPEPLSRLRPGLPTGLVLVVDKMMAKRPADRYQTPAEVAAALEPFEHGTAEDSLTRTAVPRAGKPSRRRRGPLAAALAALLLAAAAVAAAVLHGVETNQGTQLVTAEGDDAVQAVRVSRPQPPVAEKPVPKEDAAAFVNTVGIKMVPIPAGKFVMGSPKEEQGRSEDEEQHEVEISAFSLSAYEVTQAQFRAVMGHNPSFFSNNATKGSGNYPVLPGGGKDAVAGENTEDYPVENVTWYEADDFCRRLTDREKEKLGGQVYRLPREAEWEYACRGGSPTYQTFHYGNSLSSAQADFDARSPYGGAPPGVYLGRPCKVGSYQPNAFGLYDMHGNVWEWCADWYAENYYAKSPPRDPPGPPGGEGRVIRGGSRAYPAVECRSARRVGRYPPNSRYNGIGFRPALVPAGNK